MKRFLLFLGLMAMCPVLSSQEEFDLSQVQWAPTMEDVLEAPDVKMIVFFYGHYIDLVEEVEELGDMEIGRLTEAEKINEVMEAIEESVNVCSREDKFARIVEDDIQMGVVNEDNQGLVINLSCNHTKETVEWWGFYSKRLYDILIEYKIIKPPEKPIYINEPDSIHFESPQLDHSQEKPKVITTYRDRDLEEFYVLVDPKKTPVYVQVDPNSPQVYVAVDPNLANVRLKEMVPKICFIQNSSSEFMAQIKWLADALDVCLSKIEAEAKGQPVTIEPSDYVSEGEPMNPDKMPYRKTKPMPEADNISTLNSLMNLHFISTRGGLEATRGKIKRFERRMNRLKSYPKVNSTENGSATEEETKPLLTEYLEELRQKAEGGDALAACGLGWCYFNGQDVTKDYDEASKWFRKAVEQAAHDGRNNLGWCYYLGKGIVPDYNKPEKWFRLEAEEGNADAQYFLGWLYTYGSEELKRDESEAVKWWRKSAEQGFAEAQYELGIAYFFGIGVEKDSNEGIKWQRKAAEQGLAVAQSAMELCLSLDPNNTEPIDWLLKAAEQGNTIAQKRLGHYARGGWIDIVEGYKWSLLVKRKGGWGDSTFTLEEGDRFMGRKPMTDDQIIKGGELANSFKEVKSQVTARSVTTMYQAMTLRGENTEAHDFFFPPFW